MNKQGLITMLMMEKISAEVKRRGKNYAKGYGKGIDLAIKLIEASEDEPQKPVVIHTRKELEEAGFGWVFDCEGIEIKEVEE